MHQRGHFRQEGAGEASSPKQAGAMAKASLLSLPHHIALIAFSILSLLALFACISRSLSACAFPPPPLTLVLQNPSLQLNGLELMRGKSVVLVSHELSLTGGPLLLMELAALLKRAGGDVKWITNQKETEKSSVSENLEAKLLKNGIQILPARGLPVIEYAKRADLIILNTAVAGKWIDSMFKEDVAEMLQKTLWWIHEMRGHYFNLEFVKHLPKAGCAMIDSYATAEYWKNRTKERLSITMPPTFVVHLGNSQELTEASEDFLARRIMRQHVREGLGLNDGDIVFAVINSVSRGKGQDLFLKSFVEAIQVLEKVSLNRAGSNLHAVIVGCDAFASKFELELKSFVVEQKIGHLVHFVSKTMNAIPYLAAIDVLVQNSQARGECFGRITIEAMAFQLPVLGTAAGGTKEIIVNGTTGLLHPVGKEGVAVLARNMVFLVDDASARHEMGRRGHERVQERFLEKHMAERIGKVLRYVLFNKTLQPASLT